MALACREVDIDALKADTLKESVDELSAHIAALNVESQGVDTLVEDVESLGIGSLCIVDNDVLTHSPYIVVLLVTTYEWELSRQSVGGGKTLDVLPEIEGLHIEALIGSPNEFFLKVGTL